jgi:MtN3 and saliva related transmembrane protein
MEIVGLIAAFLSTSSFIPQVWKVYKTKDTSAISLLFILAINLGTFLWCIYGIYLKNPTIVGSNILILLLSGIIVFYKVRNIFFKVEKI